MLMLVVPTLAKLKVDLCARRGTACGFGEAVGQIALPAAFLAACSMVWSWTSIFKERLPDVERIWACAGELAVLGAVGAVLHLVGWLWSR